ncbi:mechanosensitive ion channel [Gammaproteobacteria bacterium]|nr:mechanosensitive ion channel [Gammaproteobacteria bacterium]
MVICKVNILFLCRLVCRQFLALFLLGLLIPAQAAEAVKPDALPQAQATLERLEKQFATARTATAQELKTLRKEIATVRSSAQDCVQQTEPKIEILDSELAILQPAKPKDTQAKTAKEPQPAEQPEAPVSPVIARQQQDLLSSKASLEGRIATCKLMLLSSNDLDSKVGDYLHSLQTRQLLARGPTLVSVLQENLDERKRWLDFTSQLTATSTGWDALRPIHLAGAAAVGLLGFILGRIVPRRLRVRAARMKVGEEEVSAGLVQAVMACGASYAPILLALGGVITYLTIIPRAGGDLPFVLTLLYGLLAYIAIAAGIKTLLNPCPPATHYLPLPEAVAIPLSRRSRVLALIVLFRWLMLELHADGLLDETMFALTRQIVGWVFILNVIWAVWLLRRLEGWRGKWALLLLISLGLFGGGVAGTIGYINLGALVITGIAYTLILLGLALVVSQFFSDLFDGLDEGRYRWQKAVRRSIGLKDGDYVPGLGWLRLVINLALWASAALLVLLVWDPDEEITADILLYFTEGFQVGGVTIVPTQLLWAMLVFTVLLVLTGWLKGRLNTTWLVKTRMEPSAREALVTTFGYVGVAIAIMVALSFAGINFASLAIIAGALSVGIGFGLQNIVNNFVSGIIMLVERPVRTGDWIVVGNTEGYVQRISIRTTTIQTLDRADIIVPNSDLISGQVTNWTLGNTWGRIKIPIGVAYGSNIETVIEILLEVANNNAEVIKDMNVIKKSDAIEGDPDLTYPSVLFLDFGDSSLDFELRVIIRDINLRRYVTSDLNRAINAAFTEKGIEIPFPRRDVNFRGPLQVEPGSSASREATGGGEAPQ